MESPLSLDGSACMPAVKAPMSQEYNAHSSFQMRGALPLAKLLESSVSDLVKEGVVSAGSNRTRFAVLDCGSSLGANSSRLVSRTLDALYTRHKGASLSVSVVHNDLPSNGWEELFATVHDEREGYVTTHNKDGHEVFAVASGRSMYRRVVPSSSVHLAFCASSLHWMDSVPPVSQGGLRGLFGMRSQDPVWRRHKLGEIQTFLAHRADELTEGGRLCIAVPTLIKPRADELGGPNAWLHIDEALQRLVDEGRLSDRFLESAVLPMHFVTADDFASLFDAHTQHLVGGDDRDGRELVDPARPLQHSSLPLSLCSLRVDAVQSPAFDTFQQKVMQAEGVHTIVRAAVCEYVHALVGFVEAVLRPTLVSLMRRDLELQGAEGGEKLAASLVGRVFGECEAEMVQRIESLGAESVARGGDVMSQSYLTAGITKHTHTGGARGSRHSVTDTVRVVA